MTDLAPTGTRPASSEGPGAVSAARQAAGWAGPLVCARIDVRSCSSSPAAGGGYGARVSLLETAGEDAWSSTGQARGDTAADAAARSVLAAVAGDTGLIVAALRRLMLAGQAHRAVVDRPDHDPVVVGGGHPEVTELAALAATAPDGSVVEVDTPPITWRAARLAGIRLAVAVPAGGAGPVDRWLTELMAVGPDGRAWL